VWDNNVVEMAIENTPSQWESPLSSNIESHLHGNKYDPLIRRVLAEGIKETWASEVDSWTQCPTTSSTPSDGDQVVLQSQSGADDTDDGSVCPLHWSYPIHQLTCDWAWPKQLDQPPYDEQGGPLLEVDTEEYAGKITQELVVEKLLTMSGLRLASILNLIFAQQQDH
jgi:hypothetical protein